jgi:predicted nuclease of predicted toxin-antitoxin system
LPFPHEAITLKFLIDNALSPIFSKQMQFNGFDSIHVRDLNMQQCPDEEIFDYAQEEERIIVSADTDFGTILALRNERFPSVIIFRRTRNLRPIELVEILFINLKQIEDSLKKGSIVIIEDGRIRIRYLPIMQ